MTGRFVHIFPTFLNILYRDVTGPRIIFDPNSLKVAGMPKSASGEQFPEQN